MNKKNIIIVIVIVIVGIIIAGLYGTFASDSSTDNVYNIVLSGNNNEVVVPAGKSKTVIYKVTNTNKGKVRYGIAFSGDNIEVKVYDDSQDEVTGYVDYGETKFVKLYVKNTGTSDVDASINAVLGYENGGELDGVVPSGYSLVSEVYINESTVSEVSFVDYLTNLYLNNKDTDLVSNNSIFYRYASIYDKDEDETTSGGLMNDRHGSMDIGEDDGNIRYYGANPNNYIYFNCNNYNNQSITDSEGNPNCELWRIIGVFDGKVKIMRNSVFSQKLSWDQNKNNLNGTSTDTSYNNDWSNSSLQEFLNGKYYDRGEDETLTYYTGNTGSSSVSINLESIGIKNDTTRGLISESLWYLKGWNDISIYSDQMYDYERNIGKVYNTSWPTTMPGNIAIPYASDYGYAVDFGSCSKTLYDYDNAACKSTNWMKSILETSSYGWLMTPHSSLSGTAWAVSSSGYVSNGNVFNALGVAPVLHLNSELGIKTGDGSSGNPYKLEVKTENKEQNFVQYLTNKYMSANPSKATVANNGINYYYAPSVGMMNDGMGSNHTWEDGANTGNIRYYGASPANYIDIGDRDSSGNVIPWRIIGVFKNMTLADGTTDSLVKLVRDDSIGDMVWDDDSNDWHSATLQEYLNNGEYYTNLSQNVKDKIETTKWNLGGSKNSDIYVNDVYGVERTDEKCSSCTYESVWEGNIALMYPSDYGYATDLTKCNQTLYTFPTDATNCTGNDWLFNGYLAHLLTPSLFDGCAWYIFQDGDVWPGGMVYNVFSVSPTLYLKSNLLYESGDGTTVESAYVVR